MKTIKSNLLSFLFFSFLISLTIPLLFAHSHSLFARVIYVPDDYTTIQSAIDASVSGDIIIVKPGTYTENVYLSGKNIILRSLDPTNWDTVARTVIDGNNNGPVVTFSGSESSTCVLTGFKITKGYSYYGGGIKGNGTYATISCNWIYNNKATYGGGLCACDGLIEHNTISFNTAYAGGGAYWCDGRIRNNTFMYNTAYNGGAINYSGGIIENNNIYYNLATSGGAFYNCGALIRSNNVWYNEAMRGGAFYNCSGTIRNNSILSNRASEMGGGLIFCAGDILLNTISNNLATGGGALFNCGGYIMGNNIRNNLANVGAALTYCNGFIYGNSITSNRADWGAGLYVCNATISNNYISYNIASTAGGGLAYCNGLISYNTISDNTAVSLGGGGLYNCIGFIKNNFIYNNFALGTTASGGGLSLCNATIQGNIISGNFACYNGGGLANCEGRIENNIISKNLAFYDGGGLYNCSAMIHNNTIVSNTAYRGGGISYTSGTIRNCIIWGNEASSFPQLYGSSVPSYSCIQGWGGGGTGNIISDPQFVDPSADDFHLKSSSPCIDAGCYISELDSDFEDDLRPMPGVLSARGDGSDFDIGADEFTYIRNGFFSNSTTYWQYLPFGGATSGGKFYWLSVFSNKTNLLRIYQEPGEKMNICQLVSVETGRWYRLEAKVATSIPDIASTQKVYAFIGEYSAPDRIKNTIAESFQAGNLAYATWTTLGVSFYSTSTQVGVSIISIVPPGASAGNLYIDDVKLYERAPYSASSELPLVNPRFNNDTSGWYYFAYAGASNMGYLAWSGQPGYYGFLQISQSAGDKLAGIQWITAPAGKEILGSLWILSSAPAIDSTQKVYVLMSSYDSASTKIISNVQNAIQAGNLVPYSWTELKFASYPKSTLIVPTFIVILPNNRPDATLYIDECRFYAD